MAFAATINLGALNGVNGFSFAGETSREEAGSWVALLDLNGDGFDDLVIGAPKAWPGGREEAGAVYVIWGGAQPYPASLTAAQLNGTVGFRLQGATSFDGTGVFVAAAGDVNGDGLADMLIGAPGSLLVNDRPGQAYLIYGRTQPFAANVDLLTLTGVAHTTFVGPANESFAGFTVAGGGDINGDGYDDMLIGAAGADVGALEFAGSAYVVFGANGLAATAPLAGLNGQSGFRIDGVRRLEAFGSVMAGLGDVNGDGFDDFAVTSINVTVDRRGAAWIVHGKAAGFPSVLDLATLNGASGFRINGENTDDDFGFAVGAAGDVNGDGVADLLVTAQGWDAAGGHFESDGAAYVIFGTTAPRPAVFDLATLNGTNGFRITGETNAEVFGTAVAAGDVNGDGFDDVVVGDWFATLAGPSAGGATYVLFGKAGGFGASFDVTGLTGANGFRIDGAIPFGQSGGSVASGDLNGDGLDDIVIGAPVGAGAGLDQGRTYVVFGQSSTAATTGADAYVGTAGADRWKSLGGADTLQGLGGADRLDGGPGADKALYAGQASQYDWWSKADGTWQVKDLRAGAPDGIDTLISIETLQFSDKAVKILGLTNAEKLTDAYSNILRSTASGAELTFLNNLIGAVNGSTKTLGAAITEIVGKADQTTAVAAMSYQFFLNFVPSKGGFDYLVSPQGPNPNNINSAYYQSFNIENRYINFAVNLGKVGEGAPSFLAEYGAKTLFQATKDAYMEIFGGTVVDSKINTILDSSVGSMSRAQYFALYGGDGLTGIGTKAAMVGWLLTEAAKADLGMYASSSNAFLTDLADGAQTLVDVVGTYGKAEYIFNG